MEILDNETTGSILAVKLTFKSDQGQIMVTFEWLAGSKL
jgi:hypothetical protein